MPIDTSKSISAVTYNGVNIPLAGGGTAVGSAVPQSSDVFYCEGLNGKDNVMIYADSMKDFQGGFYMASLINGTGTIYMLMNAEGSMRVSTMTCAFTIQGDNVTVGNYGMGSPAGTVTFSFIAW